MSNAEALIDALGGVFAEEEIEVNDALLDRMMDAVEGIAAEDFVMRMYGPDDIFVGTHLGLAAARGGFADWLDAFERLTFQVETVEEIGENVLTFARQIGTSRTGGVRIEQPSAAVWKFRDGSLMELEMHLDRDKARHSAELSDG
jgi:ketosteroid isomerase-like protein